MNWHDDSQKWGFFNIKRNIENDIKAPSNNLEKNVALSLIQNWSEKNVHFLDTKMSQKIHTQSSFQLILKVIDLAHP